MLQGFIGVLWIYKELWKKAAEQRYLVSYSYITFLFPSSVDFCQTAFTGFPEPVAQVGAGLMHGAADHIVTDISGACEEVA